MRMLDEQASKRKYQEDLAQVEDQKKQNFLDLMNLEYRRKYNLENGRIGLGQADADRNYANASLFAAAGQSAAAKRAAETQWAQTQALYPTQTHWYDPYGIYG